MAKAIRACKEVFLPAELYHKSVRRAIDENPENAVQADEGQTLPFSIAALVSKKWRPGRVLRVRFTGGNPELHTKLMQYACEWSRHANIKFDFGNYPDAEIRIAFIQGDGSWSYMGTDALLIAPDKPTMNFGWLTMASEDDEIARVGLHEFGHALGFIHEHQHPGRPFEYDRNATLAYYMGEPNNWEEIEVISHVLNKYSSNTTYTQYTQFDPDSIMLYPIPNELTVGDYEVPWQNSKLSKTDEEFAGIFYPFQ